MPIDPFDRKPSDPFARSAAGKRAEDAKKPAPTKAPTVTTVTTTTAKPAHPEIHLRRNHSIPAFCLSLNYKPRPAGMSKPRGLRSYRRQCRRRHEDSAAKLAVTRTSTAREQGVAPEAEAQAAEPPDGATRADLP
jgi:hypothetical protein